MVINVTGRHVEISDSLRDHVHGEVERAFKEFPRIESVHVILALEKYRQIAEVVVQAPNRQRVEARHETEDMYQSIAGAIEKAERQMHRWLGKVHDAHKHREHLGRVDRALQKTQDAASEG